MTCWHPGGFVLSGEPSPPARNLLLSFRTIFSPSIFLLKDTPTQLFPSLLRRGLFMAQAVLRPHLPHLQDRLYHCGISAFILTEQRRCRGKPPRPTLCGCCPELGQSEGISVTAGVPGALQKYFVTARSEPQHTAFTTSSLRFSSSKLVSLLREGAAPDRELGHWGGHWQLGRQQLSLAYTVVCTGSFLW